MHVVRTAENPRSAKKRQTLARLSALSLTPWIPASVLASAIHALPRTALVIGNSAYSDAPLRNPSNDANAIGGELKRMGFSVDLQINAKRDAMDNALRSFSASLAKNRGIGLFYFAGHGLQLDWRNFLVPVDAHLNTADDVVRQTVEIGNVLKSLGKVGNPMNIVVLDACRDNPFGSEHRTGKGLSQMDAPIGTLLAYATAPGNVASDGAGKNGLYTENLIREMAAPDAKIEDVFKRVRLAVRRSSQGQQIPWESTSLEEDFYFIPPTELRKRSQEELDRLFAAELAQWNQAQQANDPDALIAYLKSYPSGQFSELAQTKLDRLLAKQGEKRIRIVDNAEENPYTKGSAAAGQFQVGDKYEYRVVDLLTKLESKRLTLRVTEITDSEVIFNNGQSIIDLLGNLLKTSDGRRYSQNQCFASEYTLGKTWKTHYQIFLPDGSDDVIEQEFRVVAKEDISVPAGTFSAFRVEAVGWLIGKNSHKNIRLEHTYWIAPGKIPRFIAYNIMNRNSRFQPVRTDRTELVSFAPGG